MNDLPCPPLALEVEDGPGTVRLRLTGDLDYDTSEQLVERARAGLAAGPGPRDLMLDCSGLRLCDSSGVSALLLIHRATTAGGVALHLENAPAFLGRILDVTGIRALFVLDGDGAQAERAQDVPPPVPSG
ncbi:STAS domain-containing protein [Streptomyces sp. NPDC056796]|uniref:STAS domain-containing protein n=1 Tax=Streptomyces sp. NPDC056796 TaxID=3345947 RepID=UPI00368FF51E